MSNKKASKQDNAKPNTKAAVAAGVFLLFIGILAFVFRSQDNKQAEQAEPVVDVAAMRAAALASEYSPSIGNPNAKVQIVEFLDPACGTCAMFYPMVKSWMEQVPGQIHLTVRHVAFHEGVDEAVKVLEASRKQDKYWETLEALLKTQQQWVLNHVVQKDRILPAIASVGLDIERLKADMNSMETLRNFEKDKQDSVTLKVTATPEYFVNGRQMASFGQQQLADLVREELEK